eukprot:3054731-Prorocentrum_lima.AAC.1
MHKEWLDMTSKEKARLEATFALGQQFPIPPMASKLESILRVDIYDCLPTYIVQSMHQLWSPMIY